MPKTRTRAPKDGGSIDQRPNGRWRLRVWSDGRQLVYGQYGSHDEVLRAQARWRLTGLLPDQDPEIVGALPESVAVGGVRCDEWFERWLEDKAARQSVVRVGKRRGGAPSTEARDRGQWKTWWSPAIGDRLPHVVRESDIAKVLKSMDAKGRAPNTIRTHWVMIRAFFNWLVAQRVLRASPILELTVSVDAGRDRVRDIVVPDFTFLDLLSRRLGEGEDRLVFELLVGTGGRRSEVAGLTVGDVDLAARRVWIRHPVVEVEGRLVRNPRPKGGRERAVIVGPHLAELLGKQLAGRGMPVPDEPLILGERGGGLRWTNYIARTLRPAIHSAAVRWAVLERRRLMAEGMSRPHATAQAISGAEKLKRLTPHHLRHTAAALLWAAGASDIEVQLILGHADIETSRKLYAHLLDGAGESAAARVEQLRQARRGG